MQPASYQRASYGRRPTARQRATSAALTVAIVALLLLMLLRLGVPLLPKLDTHGLSTFDVADPQPVARAPSRVAIKRKEKGAAPAARAPVPKQQAVTPVPVPPTDSFSKIPGMIVLSKDQYASADVGKLPSHGGEGEGTEGKGKDSTTVYGPGEGPGGAALYNAEWVREPTNAEMAFYMPKSGAPDGAWAMVACRTIERNHVDDCRELGESPPGAGLSRALRQAAWQFLVRPPRRDGKPLIGAWVRIRFDFTLGRVVK